MDRKFTETRKGVLTIILLCLAVSSSSEAAQETQLNTPLEPRGEVINSPAKPQQQGYGIGYPIENRNQPILGQPSSSSSVNQPLTGAGLNQPSSSTGFNQPIIGQQSASSSLNQPITGLNQPSPTGFNQPLSSSSLSQPFPNRLNQNSLTGNSIPFLNGNSKLEPVSATKIFFISIALLLALYGTGRGWN